MKILAQYSLYQCGECAEPLEFEQTKVSEESPRSIGKCVNEDRFSNITGELLRKGCSRAGIKLRVELQLIDCEIIE